MIYFAYGANLQRRGMKRRCPAARPIGAVLLPGYRLCFRRHADIEEDKSATVPGALWELTPACERALDSFEGPEYRKITVELMHDETSVSAIAYVMNKPGPLAPPSMTYYRELAMGYRDWKFDEKTLRRARYDTLNVGPVPASAAQKPAPQQRQRRALWDPATQASGSLEDVIRPGHPRIKRKPGV
ncbi:MAG: gamma-glutamylcyclotransferase [Rhodospirillaceae bacterium]|nr:gamma-glutamylcyclotransferase [Rhodospirillaceae bacterium]